MITAARCTLLCSGIGFCKNPHSPLAFLAHIGYNILCMLMQSRNGCGGRNLHFGFEEAAGLGRAKADLGHRAVL